MSIIPDDIAPEILALLRGMSEVFSTNSDYIKASVIYAKLVPPIDPDILMAREWLKRQPGWQDKSVQTDVDNGEHDKGTRMTSFLDGLKAGRGE